MNANIKIVHLREGYLCFDQFLKDTDLAKRVFKSRFGVEPKEIKYEPQNRNWWIGPVPMDDENV